MQPRYHFLTFGKEELDLNPYSSIKLIKFPESFCSVETKGDNLDKIAITLSPRKYDGIQKLLRQDLLKYK